MTTITMDASAILDGQNADAADVTTPLYNLKSAIEDTLNGVQGFDQIKLTPSTLTIASGAVTVARSFHLIDTEGAAASDDLDTISGYASGDMLILKAANSAHTVVVKHGTGNIKCFNGLDISLNVNYRALLLAYATDVSLWVVIGGYDVTGKLTLIASTTSAASLNIPSGTAPTSPVEGDQWNDSTQKAAIHYSDGLSQVRPGVIFTGTADVNVNTSVAETSIVPTGVGTVTLPANFFVAGKTIRLKAYGYYGTTGTPTLTLRFKLGSTVIAVSAAITTRSGVTNNGWQIEAVLTCRTTGGSGTVRGAGHSSNFSTAGVDQLLPPTPANPVTIDTTVSQVVGLTIQWGTSAAANTITCTELTLEVLN